jgi:hypothetical protein
MLGLSELIWGERPVLLLELSDGVEASAHSEFFPGY